MKSQAASKKELICSTVSCDLSATFEFSASHIRQLRIHLLSIYGDETITVKIKHINSKTEVILKYRIEFGYRGS